MTFPKMNLIEKNTDIDAMFLPTKRITALNQKFKKQ